MITEAQILDQIKQNVLLMKSDQLYVMKKEVQDNHIAICQSYGYQFSSKSDIVFYIKQKVLYLEDTEICTIQRLLDCSSLASLAFALGDSALIFPFTFTSIFSFSLVEFNKNFSPGLEPLINEQKEPTKSFMLLD